MGSLRKRGPDVVEGVRRLKAQDGPNLFLWGSSTLTSTVLARDLVDEIVLMLYPVLLGTGKRLFAEGTPPRTFELISTNPTATGVIINRYKFAGPLS